MPEINENDVITLRELAKALEAMGIYHAYEEKTARQIFEAGLKYRSENPRNIAKSESREEGPITKARLRDALLLAGSQRYDGYIIPKAGDASQAADRILEAAAEYPQGQIIQDAVGGVYRRYGEGWRTFGQHTVFPFSYPKRPLRELA